jgi:hypothetical protein
LRLTRKLLLLKVQVIPGNRFAALVSVYRVVNAFQGAGNMASKSPEGRIFLSYRREDTSGYAGRLFDHLKRHFGKDRVFMDISNIEPGVDFVESIEKALDSCDAFLVLIGKNWLDCRNASGERRLDDPDDFIRIETSTALKRNVRVFPVLVKGAEMPSSKDLPEDMTALARRNALELSDQRWDFDCNQLLKVLETIIGPPQATSAPPADGRGVPSTPPTPQRKRHMGLIGGLVVAGLVGAILLVSMFDEAPDEGAYPNPQSGSYQRSPEVHTALAEPRVEEPVAAAPAETTQPPPVAAAQRPAYTEPETVLTEPEITPASINGSWQGSDGMIYMFEQDGDYVEVYGLNNFGVVVMTGDGEFTTSRAVDIDYDLMDGTYGEASFELAPNGRLMSGTFTNLGTGLFGRISLSRLD